MFGLRKKVKQLERDLRSIQLGLGSTPNRLGSQERRIDKLEKKFREQELDGFKRDNPPKFELGSVHEKESKNGEVVDFVIIGVKPYRSVSDNPVTNPLKLKGTSYGKPNTYLYTLKTKDGKVEKALLEEEL